MKQSEQSSFFSKAVNILKKFCRSNKYAMLIKGIKYRYYNKGWDDFCNKRINELKGIISHDKYD